MTDARHKTAAQWVARQHAIRECEEAAAVEEAIRIMPQDARRASSDPDALAEVMRHAMRRLAGMANPATIESMIRERAALRKRPAS